MAQLFKPKGFSLIELMVVVAIIGILAGIAMPQFIRFQRKARQSEAKGMLSSYHTALKAHSMETGCFRGNFVAIGFQPEGELYYRLRTANNNGCALLTSQTAIDDQNCIQTDMACNAWGGYIKSWAEKTNSVYGVGVAVMNQDNYRSFAGSNLGGGSSDIWSINENKTLTNDTNGL